MIKWCWPILSRPPSSNPSIQCHTQKFIELEWGHWHHNRLEDSNVYVKFQIFFSCLLLSHRNLLRSIWSDRWYDWLQRAHTTNWSLETQSRSKKLTRLINPSYEISYYKEGFIMMVKSQSNEKQPNMNLLLIRLF